MDIDLGFLAVPGTQGIFYLGSYFVRLDNRDLRVHKYMGVNDIGNSVATRLQGVYVAHPGNSGSRLPDLVLNILRKRRLEQLLYAREAHLDGHDYDGYADCARGERIEYGPFATEYHSTSYADQGAD